MKRFHRGAALVIAMLLAALAAVVAMSVARGQQQWLAQTSHRSEQVQAQSLALAGVQWARQVLFDDAGRGTLDYIGEPWSIPLPPTPIENGFIQGAIVDAQGLLNVNDLGRDGPTGASARSRFELLFDRIGASRRTLDAIADWIDTDRQPRDDGAEDGWYAAQEVPGLAANADLVRFAELAAVRGVTPAMVAGLEPFATALPSHQPLNVNTASAGVLAFAVPGLDIGSANALVASREARPFTSVGDFRARLPQSVPPFDDTSFSVSSTYFIVNVHAMQGDTHARARALLQRAQGGWPVVVWQIVE